MDREQRSETCPCDCHPWNGVACARALLDEHNRIEDAKRKKVGGPLERAARELGYGGE
jgi:hypothetical protein